MLIFLKSDTKTSYPFFFAKIAAPIPEIPVPNTTIFFLDIEPDERIKYLQQRLIDSDIEFEPSPFPFEPHCTIKLRGATYIKDVRNMLSFKYQSAIVTLNTLSVYNHEEAILNPRLLHRANLGKLET